MRYEVSIPVKDNELVDELTVCLVRLGYEVYLSHDFFDNGHGSLIFHVDDSDIRETSV